MAPESWISVSVVVPVYSGEKFLRELVQQLDRVRTEWVEQQAPMRLAELILVDDAAVDASPTIVDDLEADYPWVTALHLMRNFGQHAATIAGVLHSSGDWVVTMDEDLQHPPAEIEPLLRKAALSGADIVYAQPSSAVHQARTRDWASRGFKRTMAILTGNASVVHFNSFRLLRGSLARAASSACGHETYFDVALSWFTNRVQFVLLELKDQRFISSGSSGYSFSRLLTHARRMLMTSRVKSIRLLGFIGVLIAVLSMIGGAAVLVQKIDRAVFDRCQGLAIADTGQPLFWSKFITFMIALILEYISILVLSAHGKPLFFVVDRSSDKTLVEYFAKPASVILIKRQAPDLAGEEQVIALFGAGLIGSAVARAIMQEGTRSAITLPFSWKDADQREADLASLSETMFGTMAGSVRHVEVVWTAGRAGFAAGWADVEEELAAFESVNRLCVQLCDALPGCAAPLSHDELCGRPFRRAAIRWGAGGPCAAPALWSFEAGAGAAREPAFGRHHPLHLSAELRLRVGHLRRPGRAHRHADQECEAVQPFAHRRAIGHHPRLCAGERHRKICRAVHEIRRPSDRKASCSQAAGRLRCARCWTSSAR